MVKASRMRFAASLSMSVLEWLDKTIKQNKNRDDRWPRIGWGGAAQLSRGVRGTSRRVPAAVQVFFLRGFPVAAFGLWSLSAPSSW
jgi:hypothetical protein